MPIDLSKLKSNTNIQVVDATATVGTIYGLLPKTPRDALAFIYIVAPLSDGKYIVARWVEIEEIARRVGAGVLRGIALNAIAAQKGSDTGTNDSYAKLRDYTFAELLALIAPAEGVEPTDVSTQEAREIRDTHKGKRMVLLNNGQVAGVIVVELLSGDTVGSNPFARGGATLTVRDGDEAKAPANAGDTPDEPAPTERVFNYWLNQLDDTGNSAPITNKLKPLMVGAIYELKINLSKPNANSIATVSASEAGLDDVEASLSREIYDITIIVASNDFTLYGTKEQVLTVIKGSYSKNSVSFAFEAAKEGTGTISAVYFIDGRCFLKTDFSIQVGGAAKKEGAFSLARSSGKTMSSMLAMASKNASVDTAKVGLSAGAADTTDLPPIAANDTPVNLVIMADPAGYRFILTGAGVTRASLNLSPVQIQELVGKTRDALLQQVVELDYQGDKVYQSEVLDIPLEVHQQTLKGLAVQGSRLFNRLFYGSGMGADARAMGDLIRQISQQRELHIEIIAERFIFPWALLFDGDPKAATIDPKGFWGFKHVIEYLPEFSVPTPINFVSEIQLGSSGKLPLTFVANLDIDKQLTDANYPPVIQPQINDLKALASIDFKLVTSKKDFISLLQDENASPFIYINCHAISKQPSEQGGVYRSRLELTGNEQIDLDEFQDEIPEQGTMKNGPIIFLNACQSAELSPQLYAGLVPEMIRMGARGVIGTEVDTPSQFAADFAKKLITRFSQGDQPLGSLLLDLRREYLEKKNNVVGLLYALYSNGGVVVKR